MLGLFTAGGALAVIPAVARLGLDLVWIGVVLAIVTAVSVLADLGRRFLGARQNRADRLELLLMRVNRDYLVRRGAEVDLDRVAELGNAVIGTAHATEAELLARIHRDLQL